MAKSAFPILERGGNGLELTDTGMELRDYFAARSMSIAYSHTVTTKHNGIKDVKVADPKRIAELAYALADAMMAERERGGGA